MTFYQPMGEFRIERNGHGRYRIAEKWVYKSLMTAATGCKPIETWSDIDGDFNGKYATYEEADIALTKLKNAREWERKTSTWTPVDS